MQYQFSMNKKQELIFIDDHLYAHEIGALINCTLDIDWATLYSQIDDWIENEIPAVFWKQWLETILETLDCHPVIINSLQKTTHLEELQTKIIDLLNTKQILLCILEILVDEGKNEYETKLYELFYHYANNEFRDIMSRLGEVKHLPLIERVKSKYDEVKGLTFVFETDDLVSIMFQELQFICTEEFVIRKCAYCRGFFWTRQTNKIYCNRIVPLKHKTCGEYGPGKQYLSRRTPAYKLYWTRRGRAFSRTARAKNDDAFQRWLQATTPYKELAKRGEISAKELSHLLDDIEAQLDSPLLYKPLDH